jgi:trigger factor
MTEARNYPGQEHLVIQYYQKNAEAKEALRAPIFEEKVVDFIIELAKITDKTVTVEALRADPDEAPPEAKPQPAPKSSEAAAAAKEEAPAKPPKPKKASAKKKTAATE